MIATTSCAQGTPCHRVKVKPVTCGREKGSGGGRKDPEEEDP
ncbi:hypothetical protein STXM2123_392 [Streptomyces sp. F-3]|nr:hypothetical protein STXM2123_392 [Streptomyces sp. F-3]